jgi:ubiquinone/menaquinone biosynthesis C-methylase UbiE
MKVNWPERVWVNSPLRRLVQSIETRYFKKIRPMPEGGRYLEIGCGGGYGARLVCRNFHPERVDAIDIDPVMIELALRKFPGLILNRAVFFVADAQHLPYGTDCFDAVFNFGIIHHLEQWDLGLKEISRVLKEGGGFYFEEIYPPLYANALFRHLLDHPTQNRFYSRQFHAALNEAGLIPLPGYRESVFGILGVAEKKSMTGSPRVEQGA